MIERHIVRPASLDLESQGRRDYWVALEHDSLWGDHLIPLSVFVGPDAQPGQGLVAFGATHGNEYEGPMAVAHVLRTLDAASVRGRVVLVPVLNPAAFRIGTRDSAADDGVNLNRAFVAGAGEGSALMGITHRIAAFVRGFLWPQVHVVLDLHAGGTVARFVPCTSFHPIAEPVQARAIEATARWFGTPLVITYQNETPGLMVSEAERLGKIAIGCELGWGGAVQAEGVRFGRQGIMAAAIHHGQVAGSIARIAHHADGTQRCAAMVDRACFTPAPFAGHFEPLLPCGAEVEEGAVVGLLHDFDRLDLPPWPVRAGVRGIVIAQAWGAPVMQGQHVLIVGRRQTFLDESG